MNWLVYHIVSGHAFFTGVALVIIAALASTRSQPITKRVTVLAFLNGARIAVKRKAVAAVFDRSATLNSVLSRQGSLMVAHTSFWMLSYLCLWSASLPAAEPRQVLADYVAKEDLSYRWTVRREGKLGSAEYAELILTSQTWRDIVWKHQLFVIKPANVVDNTQHVLLFITGGRWRDQLEQPSGDTRLPGDVMLFAALARQLKTPVAVLLHVPQQPIFDGKYEDQIIAYTFEQYIKTGDPEWPLLLPMVKSAVRGMDAVNEFCRQTWSLDIKSYTVSGASKRGWTTWLTGAVESRAVAIAPMVIDVLNMRPQMLYQKEVWGALSYKINDYSERGLDKKLDSKEGQALRQIVDPYSYRDQLKQPKLIIIGTNDHYWPLDALNLYWKDLVGPKYILYIPNNRHGLKDIGRLTGSLNALHQHVANGGRMPKLEWAFENGDNRLSLRITSDVRPLKVDAWTAHSVTRDFRAARWMSRPSRRDGDAFVCELQLPEEGCAALFGEAVFDEHPLPYYLSTNVQIVQVPSVAEE